MACWFESSPGHQNRTTWLSGAIFSSKKDNPQTNLKEGGVPHISTAGPALITYDYTPTTSQNQEFFRSS